ncbi:MAG: S8 family serine peptidase [Thermoflexales bacterium]|nr:S8 family serine peptidase [Thermoflexales bacterium]
MSGLLLLLMGSPFGPARPGQTESAPTCGTPGQAQPGQTQAPAPTGETASRPATAARIYLAGGDFDPLQTPSLSLPQALPGDDYWLVQFERPVSEADKTRLAAAGAQVLGYLPDYTFLVKVVPGSELEGLPGVRWVGAYLPAYRVAPSLLNEGCAEAPGALVQAERLSLNVVTFPGIDLEAVAAQVEALGGDVLASSQTAWRGKLRVELPSPALGRLAATAGVEWVEPAPRWQLFNNKAATILGVRPVWDSYHLHGAGQVAAVADTGLDQGSVLPPDLHDDFEDGLGASRVLHIFDRVGDGGQDVRSGHGTHVAGSLLGNGIRSGSRPASHVYPLKAVVGIAPEAKLVFQAIEDNATEALSGVPLDLRELFDQAYEAGARVHVNSWGSADLGVYTAEAQEVDEYAWEHKDLTVVFAAGNYGVDADADGVVDAYSVGNPATAKNCLSVGGTENERLTFASNWGSAWPALFPAEPIREDKLADNPAGLAAFSSRGPTLDGRFKPELVAPSTFILSTRSSQTYQTGWYPFNAEYTYMGGTSMAAPLAAGAAVLVREYYSRTYNANASAALVKATLINGAVDSYPGQYGAGLTQEISPTRPNIMEGWGRVDVQNSLYPPSRRLFHVDHAAGLATGGLHRYTYAVSDTTQPLRFSLAWTDYPGALAASGSLVNDLDLNVVGPDGTRHYPANAGQRGASQALYYDDGVKDGTYTLTGSLHVAVCFSPTSYPVSLSLAQFYLSSRSGQYPKTFRHFVYTGSDESGPVQAIYTGTSTLRSAGWHVIDVSSAGLDIASGDFFLAIELPDDDLSWAYDGSEPDGRSWDNAEGCWLKWADEDYMFRAVVREAGESTQNDRVNTVESVDIANPLPGFYTATLRGHNVPMGPQPYALVVSGAAEAVPAKAVETLAHVTIDGASEGMVNVAHTFNAVVSPSVPSLASLTPITYVWQAHQQASLSYTGGMTNAAAFSWPSAGLKLITVTALNASSAVSATAVFQVHSYRLYLPLLLKIDPKGL